MKKNLLRLLTLTVAISGIIGLQPSARAQIFAIDDAAAYKGWQTGTNYGTGFQPWVLMQTGTSNNNYTGFYLGGGDAIVSSNGQAWGMYANGASGTNASEAFRAFSNSLPVNATFKIRWHNKGIGFSSANVGGFSLRNGNSTNLMTAGTFLTDGVRFAYYYLGGGSDSYIIYDGNGVYTNALGFNSSPFQLEITLLPGDMYNLVVKNAAGTSVLYSSGAQPLTGSGTIDSAALFAFQTGGDQIFNNMEIFYSPPQIQNLNPPGGSIYVDPSTNQLTFDVTSFASTVLSNNIQLTVNGLVQTGANWTVFGSGTASNHVVWNNPIQYNQIYAGTIIASDVNGNHATNNFTFNTWSQSYTNIYIESGDYNYGGGLWIDNILTPEPNQSYGGLFGSNGVDYLEYDLSGANPVSTYRPGDLPQIENATDVDHNDFAGNGFQDYDLGYVQNGEWEDYTRRLSNNVTYAVYARMAGFGNNPTMLLERLASPTVASATQARAALGTFVSPQTGGPQNWTFVTLNDFFSNPVLVNFGGTNTFRVTDIGGDGSYNLNYLVFVATTNTAPLRPYLASGFPYPGVGGVAPDQLISFTIANRQTSVSPGTIQLFLDSSNVTPGIVLSNNAAGTIVTYQPPALMAAGTNSLQLVFSDGAVSQTNSWQFTVQTLPVLSSAWALPLTAGYLPGFAEQIAKGDDSSTNIDFPPNVARAEAQLAGTLTNSATGVPYANEALNNGVYDETNVINYAIDPLFTGIFSPTNLFPDMPAGGTNDVAMAAQMYVQLSPGVYSFGVYSDDGFKFTAGSTPADTNLVLGVADYGRAPAETAFSFIVQTNGLYPMRLVYFKAQFNGGGVELYSISRVDGTRILLNDPSNVNSIKAYYVSASPVTSIPLNIQSVGGSVVLSWTNAAFSLQSAPLVTGAYATIPGATSPYTNPVTGSQKYFRLIH